MIIQIEEILGRSEQGMTKPFICCADNKQMYFVKGIAAARKSQIAEWIAGNLALTLELPIAPFAIVNIPDELIAVNSSLELSDLGAGLAFGSQRQSDVMELTFAAIKDVPVKDQQDVLAFDWWICNGDRVLTKTGGNPNLFWEPKAQQLLVIDHNLAFDPDFDPCVFSELHVFVNQWNDVFGDMLKRQEYNKRFSTALESWSDIKASIPEEWFYIDHEMTIPIDFDLDKVYQSLKRHEQKNFWNTL